MSTDATVLVDGEPVQVHRTGSGPPVLMLHGSGPGTTGVGAWGVTAQALADSYEVVAPDHAGFGLSPLPADRRSGLPPWADRAAALMEAIGHPTYAVVGHSMGGAVALDLASRFPERVTRVVAVATMGTPGAPLSAALDAVWGAGTDRADAEDMLRRLLDDPALVTPAAVEARHVAIRAGAAAYRELFPPPRERWSRALALSTEALRAIRAPVLLVHGAQDRLVPLAATRPLLHHLDHLDDVGLHVIDECGHVPAVEHPDAFQRLLLGFLRGTAST